MPDAGQLHLHSLAGSTMRTVPQQHVMPPQTLEQEARSPSLPHCRLELWIPWDNPPKAEFGVVPFDLLFHSCRPLNYAWNCHEQQSLAKDMQVIR
jgi:hypothetical protein